jgi:hypothetical protein
MERQDGTTETGLESAYEAPAVARVPLEEGAVFTAAAISSGVTPCM